jgi:hypothetical protein
MDGYLSNHLERATVFQGVSSYIQNDFIDSVSEVLNPEISKEVIALMMEAARTSETSVDNYFTRQYIPEDKYELHTRRRENLKYHNDFNNSRN